MPVFTHNPPELENYSAQMEKVNTPCLGHLQSDYRICMRLLSETCLRSWDRPLNFVDDPDYDPDSGSGLLSSICCYDDRYLMQAIEYNMP